MFYLMKTFVTKSTELIPVSIHNTDIFFAELHNPMMPFMENPIDTYTHTEERKT